MASKRLGFLTGGLLTGALLLGTAGLALAQDPTSTPTASPSGIGQMGAGMMGGQNGTGMMGGQMGTMSADQLKQMAAIHNEMAKGGALDFSQIQALHVQHHPGR